ncbi:hypothetical protein HPB52_001193 [Rhipicephalus sanguineus]|uniref:Uncharacterized protein n=1 Tax=Rhipicephalus sanguineus TaxID=34632 RepID=A0A9D4SXB5_RHISA|nr:hypothetical protein HPB52_001193 [Rhipicephalus sanguineus]
MIPSPPQARERRLEPAELTPVHQRTSRRLRGEQPEFGPLFDSSRPVETNLSLSYRTRKLYDRTSDAPSGPAAAIPSTFPLSTPPPMPENWRAKRAIQRRIARAPTPRAEEEDWRLME